MREHQIVITLKPDQFLEVQRLARAAKAKSMGIYVRQKLLAALGIDGNAESRTSVRRTPEVDQAVGDLRRLQGELKEFVAESLSSFGEGSADAQPLVADDVASGFAPEPDVDEIEDMARGAFAISPRLGVIEPWRAPKADTAPEPDSDDANADAETLAEPIPVRDPLAELLAEQGITMETFGAAAGMDDNNADQKGDEDMFNVPRSLQERRRQLASLGILAAAQAQDEEPDAADDAITSPEPESITMAEADDFDSDTTAGADDDDQDEATLGNPPFSGGPPPKKRQL